MLLTRLKRLVGTLRFRVTFWNTIAILILVLGTFIGVRQGLRAVLQREMDEFLHEDLEEVRQIVSRFAPDYVRMREPLNRKAVSHKARAWFARVYDSAGQSIASSVGALKGLEPPRYSGPRRYSSGGFRIVEGTIAQGDQILYIRVGCSQDFVNDDVNILTQILLIASVCLVVLAPLTGYWLAGRATRPLATIAHTASRVRPGHLHERVPVRGSGDELDQLALTFNGLLDRLALHLERQRTFVANAAHELRSPLAAVRTSAEVALGQERTPEQYRDRLADVVEACDGLTVLVNQLLLLAEGEAGLIRAPRPVPLGHLATRVVDMFYGIAETKGIQLTAKVTGSDLVNGSDVHLRQVISNLVDNALKFTPEGGKVGVCIWHDGDRVHLEVRDTGTGMCPEDLLHVFERFYRADRSRQRSGGFGLGLSICEALVVAHSGQIRMDSRLGEGTCVSVSFPAADAVSG